MTELKGDADGSRVHAVREPREVIGSTLVLRPASWSRKFDIDLCERIIAIVDAEVPASLVLNLEGIDYISSSGLSTLIRLTTRNGLRIASPSRGVRDVFSLAGIGLLLHVYDSETEALAAPGTG